jgi:hypothetical protein
MTALFLAALLATVEGGPAAGVDAPLIAEAPPIGRLSDRILQLRIGVFGIELQQGGARLDEGFLWEKLADRVKLSPRAAELAESVHEQLITGWSLTGAGSVALILTPVLLFADPGFTTGSGPGPSFAGAMILELAGIIAITVGATLVGSVQAKIFDVVNAYNVDYLDSIRLDRR